MIRGNSHIQLHVGQRLSERRVASGLSLEDLADRLGVSVPELHLFETGAKPIPPKRLIQAAETLKTSLGSLLEGAPDEHCGQELSGASRDMIRFLSMPEAQALIRAFIAVPTANQRIHVVEHVRRLSQPDAMVSSGANGQKPAHPEE